MEGRRLSRPSWLVSDRDGLPAHRQSPIQVLTGPAIEQLRWFDTMRCCYATPPTMSRIIPLCLNTWPSYLCLCFHIMSYIFPSSWAACNSTSLLCVGEHCVCVCIAVCWDWWVGCECRPVTLWVHGSSRLRRLVWRWQCCSESWCSFLCHAQIRTSCSTTASRKQHLRCVSEMKRFNFFPYIYFTLKSKQQWITLQ